MSSGVKIVEHKGEAQASFYKDSLRGNRAILNFFPANGPEDLVTLMDLPFTEANFKLMVFFEASFNRQMELQTEHWDLREGDTL